MTTPRRRFVQGSLASGGALLAGSYRPPRLTVLGPAAVLAVSGTPPVATPRKPEETPTPTLPIPSETPTTPTATVPTTTPGTTPTGTVPTTTPGVTPTATPPTTTPTVGVSATPTQPTPTGTTVPSETPVATATATTPTQTAVPTATVAPTQTPPTPTQTPLPAETQTSSGGSSHEVTTVNHGVSREGGTSESEESVSVERPHSPPLLASHPAEDLVVETRPDRPLPPPPQIIAEAPVPQQPVPLNIRVPGVIATPAPERPSTLPSAGEAVTTPLVGLAAGLGLIAAGVGLRLRRRVKQSQPGERRT